MHQSHFQERVLFGMKEVLLLGQQVVQLADADGNFQVVQLLQQQRLRHPLMVILVQHVTAQLRAVMSLNMGRQLAFEGLAFWP